MIFQTPSIHFFSFGIDPLLVYLEKRLDGILISSFPVQGPVCADNVKLEPLEERYKLIGYVDDAKPAITKIQDFSLVDRAMPLYERESGCRLHCDPASKKFKLLPLARWRGTLQQDDIPCPYDHI